LAVRLGRRSARLARVAELRSVKGRREQRRFGFEGATLLGEALRSGVAIEELYVTQAVYETASTVRDAERSGMPTFVVDDLSAAKISDVETPSGILAIAPMRLRKIDEMFARDGVLLVLADLNDPGNAGTLVRSADALGALGVLFGHLGVDPYHPKVVRAAMGALFRVDLALARPAEVKKAAAAGAFEVIGLATGGPALSQDPWPKRTALVVGHERQGLSAWADACGRQVRIPMPGPSDSLNAAVAGSIALYEATKRRS
jgi:TrmH family RNA methyltransferase